MWPSIFFDNDSNDDDDSNMMLRASIGLLRLFETLPVTTKADPPQLETTRLWIDYDEVCTNDNGFVEMRDSWRTQCDPCNPNFQPEHWNSHRNVSHEHGNHMHEDSAWIWKGRLTLLQGSNSELSCLYDVITKTIQDMIRHVCHLSSSLCIFIETEWDIERKLVCWRTEFSPPAVNPRSSRIRNRCPPEGPTRFKGNSDVA